MNQNDEHDYVRKNNGHVYVRDFPVYKDGRIQRVLCGFDMSWFQLDHSQDIVNVGRTMLVSQLNDFFSSTMVLPQYVTVVQSPVRTDTLDGDENSVEPLREYFQFMGRNISTPDFVGQVQTMRYKFKLEEPLQDGQDCGVILCASQVFGFDPMPAKQPPLRRHWNLVHHMEKHYKGRQSDKILHAFLFERDDGVSDLGPAPFPTYRLSRGNSVSIPRC